VPYYIDHTVKNTAKVLGASKKRVTFKFGVASAKALEEGMVGAHCRGSEHEIVFIWSLTSGKRHVMADGKAVHSSESRKNGWTTDTEWQHVFNLNVSSFGVFRAHIITQPAPQGTNMRPFDLRLNGVSFFKFNQIFQLGTPAMMARKNGPGGTDIPENAEERRLLAMARLESMKTYRTEKSPSQATSSARRSTEATGGYNQNPAATGGYNQNPAETGGYNQNPAATGGYNQNPAAIQVASSPAGNDSLISFDDFTSPPTPQQYPVQQQVSSITLDGFAAPPQVPPQAPPPPPPAVTPSGVAGNPFYGHQEPQQQQQQMSPYSAYPPPAAVQSPYSAGGNTAMTAYSGGGATANSYGGSTVPGGNLTSGGGAYNPFDVSATPAPANPSFHSQQPNQQQTPFMYNLQQQQLEVQHNGQPPMPESMMSPMSAGSFQSIATYGSAPSFAKPPPQQPQQQQQNGQEQYNTGQPQYNMGQQEPMMGQQHYNNMGQQEQYAPQYGGQPYNNY